MQGSIDCISARPRLTHLAGWKASCSDSRSSLIFAVGLKISPAMVTEKDGSLNRAMVFEWLDDKQYRQYRQETIRQESMAAIARRGPSRSYSRPSLPFRGSSSFTTAAGGGRAVPVVPTAHVPLGGCTTPLAAAETSDSIINSVMNMDLSSEQRPSMALKAAAGGSAGWQILSRQTSRVTNDRHLLLNRAASTPPSRPWEPSPSEPLPRLPWPAGSDQRLPNIATGSPQPGGARGSSKTLSSLGRDSGSINIAHMMMGPFHGGLHGGGATVASLQADLLDVRASCIWHGMHSISITCRDLSALSQASLVRHFNL